MRGVCRRIGIFAVALMVVTSMVAPSAMAAGSATASTPDDACEEYGKYGQQLLSSLFSGSFDTLRDRCKAKDLVQNASWSDIYGSGLAVDDLNKASITPIRNHLEDSKTYGRTIAKTEAVKLFNNESNGLNKSEIKASVNDSIEDYYANFQKNIISTHNATANQLIYLKAARPDTQDSKIQLLGMTGDGDGVARTEPFSTSDIPSYFNGSGNWKIANNTTTLVTGEQAPYRQVQWSDVWFRIDGYPDSAPYKYSGAVWATDPSAYWGFDGGDTDGDYNLANESNTAKVYDSIVYQEVWQDIEQNATDMKREAAGFVDDLYTNYNRSEGVPVSEVLNPNDLASQWNTNYNSTGYYGWQAARLGLTGIEGNVNSSFAINYTPRVDHYDNGNYSINGSGEHDYAFVAEQSYNVSGTLMTDWDPNPNESYAFERGATYDTATADAPVLFIEQVDSNSSRVVRLNGSFKIDTLNNVKTGETINSTSLEEQNQQTWNESSSVTEIRNLVEYRNKSVTINEAGGGGTGGGGGFNFDFGAAGMGFIVILLGGAFVVSRGLGSAS